MMMHMGIIVKFYGFSSGKRFRVGNFQCEFPPCCEGISIRFRVLKKNALSRSTEITIRVLHKLFVTFVM